MYYCEKKIIARFYTLKNEINNNAEEYIEFFFGKRILQMQ